MQRHSVSLVSFCLLFGILIGAAGLSIFALIGGILQPETGSLKPDFKSISATERLDTYRCRPAETKKIIMGGVEDHYSADGDETTKINPGFENWKTLTDNHFRMYDEAGVDKVLADDFDIPAQTFHGIIAIGLKEISNIRNDEITLGIVSDTLMAKGIVGRHIHRSNVAELEKSGWRRSDTYYWADLKDLNITTLNKNRNIYEIGLPHLLSGIRDRKKDEILNVRVVDDTQVDFIGFAICLEPKNKKGLVYNSAHYLTIDAYKSLPPNHVFLNNSVIDGKVCATGGCLSCDMARPVACIKDENLPAPDDYGDFRNVWSGGYIDFTPAIPGASFKTEDDVDRFCQKNFGESWRHLNGKDGNWQGGIIGIGQIPEEHSEFWVGMKDSPHHNCWDLRPEYETDDG